MNIYRTRPPLESLACVNPECEMYGQTGADNLIIRKEYGQHARIRFLRCRVCREEFSERKNTALWNCKIPEEKAVSVCEHLSEGTSIKGTARLLRVDPGTVRRLNQRSSRHGQQFHDQQVRQLPLENLQGTEASLFFRLVVRRYERSSLIVTSNKSFLDWGEIFNDHVLATAILDRLLHYSTTLNIKGESYRLKEKRKAGLLGQPRAEAENEEVITAA